MATAALSFSFLPPLSNRPSAMAAAVSSISFLRSISAGPRPKSRNPRKTSSKTPNSTSDSHLKPRDSLPLSYRSAGGEATTYTRLPPKDDFSLDSSSIGEVKLDEAAVLALDFAKNTHFDRGSSGGRRRGQKDSTFLEEVEEEEDEEVVLSSRLDSNAEEEFLEDELVFEEDGEFEEDVKEKGVPAVMRCFDTAKIYVKAGDGGNGVVAFRREKFVPFGGPSGGDGGRGGAVYVEVDGSMNSLLPFRKAVHFRAERGAHGQGRNQVGAKGEDVIVKVAPGTVIREARKGVTGEGEILLELVHPGERALLLPGGRGGRGNASFKSGTHKVPKIAENGEEGAEMWLDLELKLVADVGIVGAPNAGKSTLLSAISAAEPTIANYPFTTLLPNLGVVTLDYDATMVVADLPGLLEGAHRGFGLGHEFLRHSERCSVLVHVVDGSGQQPDYEFDAVRLELELFSPSLAEKPYIVVYNKMDLPEAYERWDVFRENLVARGVHPYCISAMNRQGTNDVVLAAFEVLRKEREAEKETEGRVAAGWTSPVNLNHVADTIQKQRSTSMNDFKIIHDSSTNTWDVVGAGIQRFVQMTNWQYADSLRRFQHVLEACGVNKALIKHGVKEGDTVVVGEVPDYPSLAEEPSRTSSSYSFNPKQVPLPLKCKLWIASDGEVSMVELVISI